MKYVQLKLDRMMGYPVGQYMLLNLPLIGKLVDCYSMFAKSGRHNIFCMGNSGSIISTIFAQRLPGSNIYPIRKQMEFSHSHHSSYKGKFFGDQRNIIVDDLICTGKTVLEIYQTIRRLGVNKVDAIIVGNAPTIPSGLEADLFISSNFPRSLKEKIQIVKEI